MVLRLGFAFLKQMLDLEFLATDAASFVPVYLTIWIELSANRTWATPVRLRQRLRPRILRSRAISNRPDKLTKEAPDLLKSLHLG